VPVSSLIVTVIGMHGNVPASAGNCERDGAPVLHVMISPFPRSSAGGYEGAGLTQDRTSVSVRHHLSGLGGARGDEVSLLER
jgi:hypothetical protein